MYGDEISRRCARVYVDPGASRSIRHALKEGRNQILSIVFSKSTLHKQLELEFKGVTYVQLARMLLALGV